MRERPQQVCLNSQHLHKYERFPAITLEPQENSTPCEVDGAAEHGDGLNNSLPPVRVGSR